MVRMALYCEHCILHPHPDNPRTTTTMTISTTMIFLMFLKIFTNIYNYSFNICINNSKILVY